MGKTKIYFKNNKAFFKKGGRFYELPEFQGGDDLSTINNINNSLINAQSSGLVTEPTNTQNFFQSNPAAVMSLAGTGANMISNFGGGRKSGNQNLYDPTMQNYMKGYNNDKFSSSANTLLDTAAGLDPTGTTALVSGAIKLGKGVGNLVKNEDEFGISQSGAQEAIGNALDPLGRIQQSINIGKKHGFGEGVKDLLTFGISGNNLMKEDVKKASNRIDYQKMAERSGMNKGNYRNDSVYAKKGVNIQSAPFHNKKKPNVEIEDGEILLGNPGSVTKYGNATTSLNSKFASKFHGDKHGQDTDKDGMEGIPLNSDSGYIASNYLGMDGRVVKKQKGGKSGKTVADEMTPLVNYLHEAEQNSEDIYKSNPVAIKQVLNQLENMKNTAEQNKFRRELEKMVKNDEVPLEDVLSFIQQNAPAEDMSPEQLEALNSMMPEQPQQMPAEMPMGKNGLNMYRNKYQMGGMPTPQDEQQPNPSSDKMMQLMQQAQQQVNPTINPAMENLDPEVQQMFSQLPPDVQQQIMQMPPDQIEIAIMNAFQQMQSGQQEQGMDPAMQEQGMNEAAMMAEQQALMKLGGYTNEYFGDKYKGKNYDYQQSQDPKAASAHMPRPVLEDKYNPVTKTHMKQMAAFQDNYQTGGAINNEMVKMVQQLMAQGYSQEQAIQVATNKLSQGNQGQMKSGGMVGRTVTFKMGGQIISGKVKSYDPISKKFELE